MAKQAKDAPIEPEIGHAVDFETLEALKTDEARVALGEERCTMLCKLVLTGEAVRRDVLAERLKSEEEAAGMKFQLTSWKRRAELAEMEAADLRVKAGGLEQRYFQALDVVRSTKAKLR